MNKEKLIQKLKDRGFKKSSLGNWYGKGQMDVNVDYLVELLNEDDSDNEDYTNKGD